MKTWFDLHICLVNLVCPKLLHYFFNMGFVSWWSVAHYMCKITYLLLFGRFWIFYEILKNKYGDKYSRQQCLSNDFPNFKRILKTHNDKINSSKKMKLHHYSSQTNNELLIMKLIILVSIQTQKKLCLKKSNSCNKVNLNQITSTYILIPHH